MMSQKTDEEKNVGIEEITESESSEIVDAKSESSEIVDAKSELPPAPDTRSAIERDLKAKIDAGENLSVKSVYTKIFNEIAQKNKCSYVYVSKIAKGFLKKKSDTPKEKTTVDSNKIEIKTVSPTQRPGRKVKPTNFENIINTIDVGKESASFELEFETAILEMSFDNIAGIMRTLRIPAPQAKRIKHQAKLIAMFNQKMIQANRPDQCINVGEKLLPIMLKISTIGMFVEPIGKMLMKIGDKKSESAGIIEEKQSMRD
jgi:hypothetical protein